MMEINPKFGLDEEVFYKYDNNMVGIDKIKRIEISITQAEGTEIMYYEIMYYTLNTGRSFDEKDLLKMPSTAMSVLQPMLGLISFIKEEKKKKEK